MGNLDLPVNVFLENPNNSFRQVNVTPDKRTVTPNSLNCRICHEGNGHCQLPILMN